MKKKTFNMYSLIEKKKQGKELAQDEISWIIENYTEQRIPDYQISAWLMSIYFQGMTPKETQYLTDAMLYSGEVLNIKDKTVVDKHSTGGIGDKTSFILAPIAAAAGIKVPMIAGRGLGFTGGTVDKIECLKGFNTSLSLKEFKHQLLTNGLVLIGQTPEIAPADRLLYALRDVTATVDSIPLITASIMSKKLAEGAQGLVLDIKWGSGAFMSSTSDAIALGKSLIDTAKRFNRKAVALVTDMNQPLGDMIGNSLEIIESIQTLKNQGPKDLSDLSFELAAHMVFIGGKASSLKEARSKVKKIVDSGAALDKFAEMIKIQGGDPSQIYHEDRIPVAPKISILYAPRTGYIKSFENKDFGMMLVEMGGGRKSKSDKLDLTVGLKIHKKIGDKIIKGEPLITFYHHTSQTKLVSDLGQNFLKNSITLSTQKVSKPKLIYKILK